jgi:HEAT repeat protein
MVMNGIVTLFNNYAEAKTSNEKCQIIKQLSNYKEEKVVDRLIKILAEEKENEVKSFATMALIKINNIKLNKSLIKLLKHDSWITRMKVVEILGESGDKKAIKPLITRLKKDPHKMVRVWAAISLGKIKTNKAINALLESLDCDECWEVRREAAHSIGQVGNKEACSKLKRVFLSDDNYEVRWAAAASLFNIDKKNYQQLLTNLREKLLKILQTETNENILCAAARTLGEIGNKKCVPTLVQIQRMNKELVRLEINVALGKIAQKMGHNNIDTLIREFENI